MRVVPVADADVVGVAGEPVYRGRIWTPGGRPGAAWMVDEYDVHDADDVRYPGIRQAQVRYENARLPRNSRQSAFSAGPGSAGSRTAGFHSTEPGPPG